MQEAVGRTQTQQGLERASLFAILLVVDSLHFVFARLLLHHVPPMASTFYVLAVATVEVGIFAAVRRKLDWRPAVTNFPFFAAIGFFIASSTLLNYIAVEYIDPGTASMLGKTGVIISLLLGVFWLRERLTRLQAIGAVFAVMGAVIISFHPGDVMQVGSLMILTSSFLYSLHTALVKRYGQEMDFVKFFFHRLLFTASFLFLFAVVGRRTRVARHPDLARAAGRGYCRCRNQPDTLLPDAAHVHYERTYDHPHPQPGCIDHHLALSVWQLSRPTRAGRRRADLDRRFCGNPGKVTGGKP